MTKTKDLITFKEPKKRMPRPWGLTHLASAYHLAPDTDPQQKQELKLKLITHTLNHYLTKGMQINGIVMNIAELSMALNEEPNTIQEYLNTIMLKRGTMFDDGIKGAQWAREQFSQAQNKALEIQALTHAQAALLARAQGTQYVPFLSTAVNAAIANLINAQKPNHELLKMLIGISGNPLVTNPDGAQSGKNAQYISPEKAMELIANNGPSLIESGDLLAAKELELSGTPEVNARYQNLKSIGIRYDGTKHTDTPTTDHADRRNPGIVEVEDEADFKA